MGSATERRPCHVLWEGWWASRARDRAGRVQPRLGIRLMREFDWLPAGDSCRAGLGPFWPEAIIDGDTMAAYFGCRLRSRAPMWAAHVESRKLLLAQAGQLVSRILRLTWFTFALAGVVEPGGLQRAEPPTTKAPWDGRVQAHADPSTHSRQELSRPRTGAGRILPQGGNSPGGGSNGPGEGRGTQGNGAGPALDSCCHLCGPRDNKRQQKRTRSLAREETTDGAEWPTTAPGSLGEARSWAAGDGHWPGAPATALIGAYKILSRFKGAQQTVVSERLSSQPTCASANDKKALRRTDKAVVRVPADQC